MGRCEVSSLRDLRTSIVLDVVYPKVPTPGIQTVKRAFGWESEGQACLKIPKYKYGTAQEESRTVFKWSNMIALHLESSKYPATWAAQGVPHTAVSHIIKSAINGPSLDEYKQTYHLTS